MKSALCILFLGAASLFAVSSARADLTIVQKVEGIGAPSQMTIKIKGDRMRADVSPQVTTIFDAKSGEIITLMNDEKTIVRMSANQMTAASEMMKKSDPQKENTEKPKVASNGQRETINGFETEQYVYDSADFKATYWVARSYPKADDILNQLRAVKSDALNTAKIGSNDVRDLPGIPLRTKMIMKKSTNGNGDKADEITTTISSIKTDPVNDSEFAIPKDFKELQMPDLLGGKGIAPSSSPDQ